jgi:hypothetical protein
MISNNRSQYIDVMLATTELATPSRDAYQENRLSDAKPSSET